MKTALIGYTGFVGSNLLKQTTFSDVYNSVNIKDICGKEYDTVVCAGLPAAKWLANKDPIADENNMLCLWECIKTVKIGKIILISTIDVYEKPIYVDENSKIGMEENHAYGKNRYKFEELIRSHFKRHLIVRLPGLFGNGLKKNVIYDLLHNNQTENVIPNCVYQYYCLDWLWKDISIAEKSDVKILNLTTEPLSTQEIVDRFFLDSKIGMPARNPTIYDFRTIHGSLFSKKGHYIHEKAELLKKLEEFVSSYQGKN